MKREVICTIVIFFSITTTSLVKQSAAIDVKAQKEVYEPNYSYYHNLTQIYADTRTLVQNYGDFIHRTDKFKSKAGKSQILLRVSNFTKQNEDKDKVKLLLSFGEHAREFFPVESAFYFLKNLTSGLFDKSLNKSGPGFVFSSWVVNNFDVFIIAMVNPDGRDNIEQSKNYCWRGTQNGVDINRNFDWNYGDKGSSKDPNDGEFRGSHAFSEPETDIFRKLTSNISFDAFVSFHSGIRHIYIPYADTKSRLQHRKPANKREMLKLAGQISRSSPKRPFKFGLAYELNGYTADGTSFDYMAGVAAIPFSFAIEMWGNNDHFGRSCFDEFNPRSEDLQREVELVHPLYVELLSYLYQWKQEQNLQKARRRAMPTLRRTKKDETPQKLPDSNDVLYISQASPETKSSASFEIHLLYVFFVLLIIMCAIVAVRHLCHLVRKKRVISLRSLSSTFSLFKSL